MNAVERFALRPDVRAAIVWDLPALRGLGPSAVNFLRAFGPPPWNLEQGAVGPINQAGLAVVAANEGAIQAAVAACEPLVVADDASVRLLGLILRAWVADQGPDRREDLRGATAFAGALSRAEDRARVCRKLAIWAWEIGESELALGAARSALKAATPNSRVAWSVRELLWVLGDRSHAQPEQIPPADDLLEQPWITDLAFHAVNDADLERFRDALAGVWGGTIRIGQTSLDVLNAAQRQADWAALPNTRDALLRLLCAHVLDHVGQSDAQIRWAAASWVLAGGDRVSAVLERAERSINSEIARELLDEVLRNPLRREKFPEVAASLWRQVDDDQVGRLLDALDPGEPGHTDIPEPRQLWANMLWRDPELWYEKWRQLDPGRRQGAMALLIPEAVDQLWPAARQALLEASESVIDPRAYAVIGAALAIAQGHDARRWLDLTRPNGVLQLADWRPEAVPDSVLVRSIEEAEANLVREREEAIGGQFGLGGSDAARSLGGLVARRGKRNRLAEQLLVEIAADSRMSSDHQVQAMQGLAYLRNAGLLSKAARRQLRNLPNEPGRNIWSVIDAGVYQIARLWTFADDLTRDEVGTVVAACRATKAETRLIAVAIVEDALSTRPTDTTFAWSLVSALYDPSDDVLGRALEAIGRDALKEQPDAAAAATAGVVSAYQTGRNKVRRAAVWAARALEFAHPEAASVIRVAQDDPSWEVRYALRRSAKRKTNPD